MVDPFINRVFISVRSADPEHFRSGRSGRELSFQTESGCTSGLFTEKKLLKITGLFGNNNIRYILAVPLKPYCTPKFSDFSFLVLVRHLIQIQIPLRSERLHGCTNTCAKKAVNICFCSIILVPPTFNGFQNFKIAAVLLLL
jgi:hypothetical protein